MTEWQQDGDIFEDAGDVGGDDQAGKAASVRYVRRRPDGQFSVVTAYAYPRVDSNAPGGADATRIGLQVMTNTEVVADSEDPGGSLGDWADYLYEDVKPLGTFTDMEAAERAGLEYIKAYTPDRITWDGERH